MIFRGKISTRYVERKIAWLLLGVLALSSEAFAVAPNDSGKNAKDIAVIDRVLATAKPGATTIMFGDCGMSISTLETFRARLAAEDSAAQASTQAQGATPLAVTTPTTTLWPGGVVNYQFDPAQVSSGTLTPAMMRQFQDAAGEWAAAAKLTFVQYSGTQTLPANYVTVQNVSITGEGGDSFVGMKGGQQFIHITPNAWNRGTLCHEIGHTLGLYHEQSRDDRDTYVTINLSNIPSGQQANFTKLPSSTNIGPYDFYSVMHYYQYADASNPAVPSISMNPGFTQYATIIGEVYDRTLSTLDRAGMAAMYGNPTVTPSAVVTNTNDSGPGSLRAAIYYAFDQSNATPPVATTVTFHIPKTDPNYNSTTGVFTIKPSYLLPSLGNGTTIDGTTEETFTSGNTNPSGGPSIVINGAISAQYETIGVGFRPALILRQSNCTVKGLIINGFDVDGIQITSSTALVSVSTGNVVSGCYIGTDSTGTVAVPNAFSGIAISGGAYNNTIGGTTAAARNVISGNTDQGIYMHDSGTTGNVIEGNYIGLAATGTIALHNGFAGIEVGNGTVNGNGAQNNTIGGTTAGARNIISGNTDQGILIDGSGTTGNIVEGNYIGLDSTGTVTVANGSGNLATQMFYGGIQIFNGPQNNIIGGTVAGAGNFISGNVADGIAIDGSGTTGNLVEGNTIGLNATGAAMGNGSGDPPANLYYCGVDIFGGAQNNTIGGTASGAGNVISGNVGPGVNISGSGTSGNLVDGNKIGTNATGSAPLANGNASASIKYAGLQISQGAQSNVIGGTTSAARNIISGNAGQGVYLGDFGTTSNVVEGNYIGTDLNGTNHIANNQGIGIYNSAGSNTIGGTIAGAGNVISGNTGDGIAMAGTDAGQTVGPAQNVIAGNSIGVSSTGTTALANGNQGVDIFGSAQSNTIGGLTAGSRNLISGNSQAGVFISQAGTNANLIEGNWIGLGAASASLANANTGVTIYNASQLNAVGGSAAGAGNIIADNQGIGVGLFNNDTPSDTIKNSLSENSIYGNTSSGISLNSSANNGQAAPSLTSAVTGTSTNPSGTTIVGKLLSAASTQYRIEYFASPSGGTQGQSFIGSTSVTTNSSGSVTLTMALTSVGVPSGNVISATATDPNGNTSQFSSPVAVTGSPSGKIAQTITFPPIANQPFNAGQVTLNAASTSGLPITYAVTAGSGLASVSSGTVTITGAGSITIQASQGGNSTYNAATSVSQSFTAGTASQTITFPTVASTSYGTSPITLAATDSSGLAITYTVVSGAATISGNTLTITGAGTVVIQANQAGNTNYTAASSVSQSFTVRQDTQSIAFPDHSQPDRRRAAGRAPCQCHFGPGGGLQRRLRAGDNFGQYVDDHRNRHGHRPGPINRATPISFPPWPWTRRSR